MLKTRTLTALLLIGLIGVIISIGGLSGWIWFSGLLIFGAAAEWANLARLEQRALLVFCSSIFLLLFNLGAMPGVVWGTGFPVPVLNIFLVANVFFWLFLVPLWLKGGWSTQTKLPMMLLGCLLLVGAWMAQVQLASQSFGLLLAALGVAWVADTAGYLVGRRWGRHLLAIHISPGKTWEGWFGGVVASFFYALLLLPVAQPLLKMTSFSWLAGILFVVVIVLVAGCSVLGDLFESLLKRQRGVKDSGFLLPGHGGILDRIDAQLISLPLLTGAFLLAKHFG